MRPLLSSLIVFSCLTGCVTQQKCNRLFPPTVHDSIVVRDSTYIVHDTIYQPYQELFFTDEIPCPDLVYSKSVKKGGLTGSVSINKGVVTVMCKSDSLQLIIDRYEHERTIERNVTKLPEKIIEYQTRWYHTASLWLNAIILLVLLGDLGLSYLRLKK